jgi:hypothetical protein
MAWIKPDPSVSKKRINAAGEVLITTEHSSPLRPEALNIINNWRSAHSYPLNSIKLTLRNRATGLDLEAIIAQRLKRLSSINTKLRRFPNMKLSSMQDIGGCRAIMHSVEGVKALVALYDEADAKNPNRGAERIEKYDYIETPKRDGYRGVHLVYRYRSTSGQTSVWNGLKVEIQLRSAYQHAWATAVETVSTFTDQQLKVGSGSDDWKRFFALMGSAVARAEKCPLVPETPETILPLVQEIRDLNDALKVDVVLEGWQVAISELEHRFSARRGTGPQYFLLVLDVAERTVEVFTYSEREQALASDEYLRYEQGGEENPNLNVVLASAESIAALRAAFPNYYLNTAQFRGFVGGVLEVANERLI